MDEGCEKCGRIDADIELGWGICAACYHADARVVLDWPDPWWVDAIRVFAIIIFLFAVVVLAAAVGQFAARATEPEPGGRWDRGPGVSSLRSDSEAAATPSPPGSPDCGVDAPGVCGTLP